MPIDRHHVEEFVARDLGQNFFDTNRDCLSQIKVLVHDHTVTIAASTPMELEHLFSRLPHPVIPDDDSLLHVLDSFFAGNSSGAEARWPKVLSQLESYAKPPSRTRSAR